ncbi:MAG TPA: SGNH/GDSL hydrolase family protein [Thermoguttaceae bacterium]|nr:SGNH/GDSL hydrolase family protein [Thermoguttaceae bacterium]
MKTLYLVDRGTPTFDQTRATIDVVCAGDSITGWNNFDPTDSWPYPTYPQFLQAHCRELGLTVSDCGIAGEVSQNGVGQVRDYLDLFPNSRYFIIGFGTNDLGTWPDTERTSRRILENLVLMIEAVRVKGRQPILFNVPYANEAMFSPRIASGLHAKRDYHNARLKDYCEQHGIPLADVCSHLRDEHFGDELHPSEAGATIIAAEVFKVLSTVHKGGTKC